jgi:DNA-binding transcriptional regulator YiaG
VTAPPINPRAARKAAKLTQAQAAALIGAKLRTWQDWEYGKRNMPPAKWAYFCLLTGYKGP